MPRDRQPFRLTPTSSVVSVGFVLRIVALALAAVAGAVWALVHNYTHPRPPMRVPVPLAADAGTTHGAADEDWGDADVVPAPDLEPSSR